MIVHRFSRVGMLRRRIPFRSFSSIPSPLSTLPPESPSWFILDTVQDFAADRGAVSDTYSPWLLTDLMQNTISLVHEYLHPYFPFEFGWLGAVAVSAVLIRGLLFPLCLQSIREGRLKQTLLPQYSDMVKEMASMKTPSSANSKDSAKLQQLQKRFVEFTAKYGNVALKGTLASAVQIPMIMTGIVACNGMAMHPEIFPAVALDAPLWFTSAALPDPYYILPALNAGLVWSNMQIYGSIDSTATPATAPAATSGGSGNKPGLSREEEQSKRVKDLITSRMGKDAAERTSQQIDSLYKSKAMRFGKKLFPLFIFGVTVKFPVITLVYTISNIGGAMVQNYLISNPRFQRTLDIPAQAKRSGDEVTLAMQRAEDIRSQIDKLMLERKRGKSEREELARSALRRKTVVGETERVGVGEGKVEKKSMKMLLEEMKRGK